MARALDGQVRVDPATEGGSRTLTLWMGPAYRWLTLFTGDNLSPSKCDLDGVPADLE